MRALLLTLLILAAAGGGPPAVAQVPRALIREDYDPSKTRTQLRVTPLVDQLPPSGFLPVRIFVYNGFRTSRRWDLDFVSSDIDYGDGNELRSDYSLTCDPGQTVEHDILVPLVTAFQSTRGSANLEVRVRSPALRSSTASHSTEIDPRWPSVLISEDLYTANRGNLSTEVNNFLSGGASSGYGGGGPSAHGGITYSGVTTNLEFGAAFNPGLMSDDWRAYCGFDACLLTEADWGKLPPGARNALLKWNRLGGSLLIYSRSPTTDPATLQIDPAARGKRELLRSWGVVRILDLASTGIIDAAETVRLVGTGLPGNRAASLHNDFQAIWPLQIAFGSKKAHIIFFILVLIAFGVLVGPVNLFVFAKAGQRHRLFITTPLISLGASLLLVVLILFQDGFGGRGQRLVLMEVRSDDRENAAYLSQEQIARTGVLLSTRFQTTEPVSLSPVLLAKSNWARVTEDNDGGRGRYTVKVRDQGLDFAGDWFQSRSEHGHVLETIRPTRGRIELLPATGAGPPQVTSTFKFPLAILYYKDPAGEFWSATNVEQGRRITLASARPAAFKAWLDSEIIRFAATNKKRLTRTGDRRDCFYAATDQAPGIETLKALSWLDTHTVLTGPVFKTER